MFTNQFIVISPDVSATQASIFTKAVVSKGGQCESRKKVAALFKSQQKVVKIDDSVTHVVVGSCSTKEKLLQHLSCPDIPDHVNIMESRWLTECIKQNTLLDPSLYRVNFVSDSVATGSASLSTLVASNKLVHSPSAVPCKCEETELSHPVKKICLPPSVPIVPLANKNVPSSSAASAAPPASAIQHGVWQMLPGQDSPAGIYKFNAPRLCSRNMTIYAFDMDGTLIVTKSGKAFATNEQDWKLFHPSVKVKLQKLYAQGHPLLIVSNQNGVEAKKTTVQELQRKIDAIIAELGVEMDVICAFSKDGFRKPRVGSWDFYQLFLYQQSLQSHGVTIDSLSSSDVEHAVAATTNYYIGDAAGRPKTKTRGKDFSSSDHKFALNAALEVCYHHVFYD